jgi:hypothetical protein|nr:MAG TPA: hypothetical protein [Caudoviricetes sp.]
MDKIKSIEQFDALGVKICELLQVGIDKVSTVVPDTLQQIVAWQVWVNGIWLVLLTVLLIVLCVMPKSSYARLGSYDERFYDIIITIFGGVFFIISVIALLVRVIPNLVKALTAPNLVIIEQLGGLVK